MISTKLINPTHTAVLVIDIQNDYCSSSGGIAKQFGFNMSSLQKTVPKIIDFVEKARTKGLPIIFFQMIENPKYMAENAKLKVGDWSFCSPNTEGYDYYQIKPQKSDHQLVKKTYDAFSNPELEQILKSENIENLIILGGYTAVCVDTTIRSGFTRGYHIVVPKDLVGMPEEQMYQHKAALDVWEIIFAHIVNSNEILSEWEKTS